MRTKHKLKIKDLPLSARPLEKLLNKGPENLTESELLAILLGTGSKTENVLTLAKKLIKVFSLNKLVSIDPKQLIDLPGIGQTKAGRVISAIELGKRVFSPTSLDKIVLDQTDRILDQVKEISLKQQEVLIGLYLNAKYELIKKEIIGVGNLNLNIIEPKQVFVPALLTPCSFIILAHNHPSNQADPSESDIDFTQTIYKAGQILGINLYDHLIVCKNSYFSFRENKQINL